jgi:transcriptional regulator with XRE-family HTH domain
MTTKTLRQRLFKAADFEAFADENAKMLAPLRLCEYLTMLRLESGLSIAQIVIRSNIARTYLHQILNGTRKPSRDKILQLAFGLGLNDDDTEKLLKTAQMSPLYPRIVRDAAILRCLHDRKNIDETQELLVRMGLTPLGRGDKNG